ncbi:hypothetical protein GCM10028809_42810 [Spirosoma gilvum]
MPYLGEFRLEDSLPIGTNDKYINYEIASPQKGYFALDNLGATIYLVPSDTLVLTIDLSQDNPWQRYQFKGTYARINQYYFDQARALKSLPIHTRAQLANEMPTLAIYQQKMDSLLKVELAFFKSYLTKHSLPLWFVQKENQ